MKKKYFVIFALCMSGCASTTEPALLHWQSDGALRSMCNQGPVQITQHTHARVDRAVRQAMVTWNITLDHEVFTFDRQPVVIYIVLGELANPQWHAAFTMNSRYRAKHSGCVIKADLGIADKTLNLTDRQLWLIVTHELGHALGLGHREIDTNIMYPHVASMPAAKSGMLTPGLETADLEWLERRWGPSLTPRAQ